MRELELGVVSDWVDHEADCGCFIVDHGVRVTEHLFAHGLVFLNVSFEVISDVEGDGSCLFF